MIIALILSLEILIVNLLVTYLCFRSKYSLLINLVILTVITILIYIFSIFVLEVEEGPSIWGIILGLIYMIPLYFLLEIKIHKLIYIMTLTWTYTLVVSGITNILGFILFEEPSILFLVLIQTIIFVATIKFMIDFVKNKVLMILEKLDLNWKYLLLFSTLTFTVIVFIRYFSDFKQPFLHIVVLVTLLCSNYIFHQIAYIMIDNKTSLKIANKIAYNDVLTGIQNRYALFENLNKLMDSNSKFFLVFMDLDQFKSINDQYGHNYGDEYIQHFAYTVKNQLDSSGEVYRFAGDEFICIITNTDGNFDIKYFEQNISSEMKLNFDFNGVSMGISSFPFDGDNVDDLIDKADTSMYSTKKFRKTKSTNYNK